MSDHWVKEAERRSDEISRYADFVDAKQDDIIEAYIDSIQDINDVPDDFIENYYGNAIQGDFNEN